MNFEQMQKSVGYRVQLHPIACRLDAYGIEEQQIDDAWIINAVTRDGVEISNPRTGHSTTLGLDHIYSYTSNPELSKNGAHHGFLTLRVQLFLQGNNLWIRPNARPGERVEPPRIEIVDKWVNLEYPTKSGLQQELEASGYQVSWVLDKNLADVELQGWEVVIDRDEKGSLMKFKVKDRPDNQILVKRRG